MDEVRRRRLREWVGEVGGVASPSRMMGHVRLDMMAAENTRLTEVLTKISVGTGPRRRCRGDRLRDRLSVTTGSSCRRRSRSVP